MISRCYLAIRGKKIHFGENIDMGQFKEDHGWESLKTSSHKFWDLCYKLTIQTIHTANCPSLSHKSDFIKLSWNWGHTHHVRLDMISTRPWLQWEFWAKLALSSQCIAPFLPASWDMSKQCTIFISTRQNCTWAFSQSVRVLKTVTCEYSSIWPGQSKTR